MERLLNPPPLTRVARGRLNENPPRGYAASPEKAGEEGVVRAAKGHGRRRARRGAWDVSDSPVLGDGSSLGRASKL